MEPSTAPAYRLAERVWKNELTYEEAVEQVVSPANLAQANTTAINEVDGLVRNLAEQDLKQAIVLALLNHTVARYKGNTAVKGKCSNTLGWLYLQQDERERALHYYREALSLLENIPQARAAIARIRLDIGEIDERHGSWDAARREYQSALASAQELKHHILESDAHNGLGRVHLALEQTEEALAAFQRALEISRQADDQRGEETALGNLGLVYRFLGQLGEAAKSYEQALLRSQEAGHEHTAGTGRHLDNLGSVLLEQGEYRKARQHFRAALKIACQMNDRLGAQQRLGNLGNLYRDWAKRGETREHRTKRLSVALKYQQRALALARERDDRHHQGDHLLNLGNVHSELGQAGAAQECYTGALQLAEEQAALDTQWHVHYALGKVCDEQNQTHQAREHYQTAIGIVEQQRKSLHIDSRIKFWQERSLLYKRMMLCCLRLGDLWAALEYTERAKARYLADLLSQHTAPTDNTQEMIQTVLQGLSEHTAVVVFNVTEAGTVVFIVTGHLSETIRTSHKNDWQLLSEKNVCVWAKRIEEFNQDTLQRFLVEVDTSGQQIGGYLFDYYTDRIKWRTTTLGSVSAEISRPLLVPIYRQLTQLPIKRIILMPNLGLSLLPLHACYLSDGDEPDYLLDHYEISYAPSFDVLRHCQSEAHTATTEGASLLAIANPTRDLPWAEFEVERIAPLFKARILDDSTNPATPETVLAEAPQYAILHFACHGEFTLSDPLQSYLKLMGEKPLQLKTILAKLKLPDTHLVVLSACETGLVDAADLADESIGLPAGFVQTGAPSVVSSLWAVDDISTALLMIRFYQYYLHGDATRELAPMRSSLALCKAQAWLRNELTLEQVTAYISQQEDRFRAEGKSIFLGQLGRIKRKIMNDNQPHPFADPYYWAAFIVLGEA